MSFVEDFLPVWFTIQSYSGTEKSQGQRMFAYDHSEDGAWEEMVKMIPLRGKEGGFDENKEEKQGKTLLSPLFITLRNWVRG